MGRLVKIHEPMISADKVYERWTGIYGHQYELARLIDQSGNPFRSDDVPVAYILHKVLDSGSNGIFSICTECVPSKGEKYYSPYKEIQMYNEIVYDFENVYFLYSQIKRYEETRPELFYKVISPEEAWDTDSLDNNIEEKHNENIPFSELVADNEQLKARITELETELAACREQEEARREISGREEHETAHGEDFPAEYDGHGLCSLVIRMRKEGKTEKEIAAFLNGDKEKWCSASQIGALLHRGGNVSADAMLKHAQRLLGKA